jgi:non-specific serine/threonine protein kinase/serine/threonine-protein kinase
MIVSPSAAKSIFGHALDIQSPAERAQYLNNACQGDDGLRAEVEELIGAVSRAGNFLVSASSGDQSVNEFGALIGPYKLLEQIGEGGMGLVYMAEQQQPVRRQVALKIIKPGMDCRQIVARFEAERQALALMDHANIARVLDAGMTQSGRSYFVMELVNGVPITKYCDQKRLTIRERLELFIPVCQAIQHAHQKGIIHRDIKPTNVLVARYDDVTVPKVIDFGVAKATEQKLTEKTMFTGFGQLIGTLEYMSPEQAQFNQLDIDTRSDIYSLGVLLYELLTGSTPVDQSRLRTAAFDETLRIIREEEPPKPSTRLGAADTPPTIAGNRNVEPARLCHAVRGDLDWIVMKCLEKHRGRRYESASGLEIDLRRYLADEPIMAHPPSRVYQLRKFVRRNRGPVLSALLLLLVLVGGIIGTTWGMILAERARRSAVSAQLAEAQRAQGERLAKEEAQKRLVQIEKATETLAAMIRDVDPLAAEREGLTTRALLGRRLGEAAQQLEGEAVGDPLVVARLQHALGISLQELGHRREAEAVLVKACQTRERLLGANDLDTAATKHHLAMLYRAQAKYDLAEPLFQESLESRFAQLGEHHADTLHSQQQLAMLYHSQGKFDLAETLCTKVLELRTGKLGADHPDTLASQHRLAMVYRSQGRLELAETLCTDVLNLRTARLGADNLDTLASKQLLAVIYRAQEKLTLAEPLYKEVLAFRTAKLGNNHPDTLGTQHHLALLYRSMNRLELSIPLLEETLKLRHAKLGPDHPSTLATQADLGANYFDAGRSADALALLVDVDGKASQREVQFPKDAEVARTEVLKRLAQLYDAAGLPGTAAQWRTKLEQRTKGSLQ